VSRQEDSEDTLRLRNDFEGRAVRRRCARYVSLVSALIVRPAV
jgi:hypothetical protein